MWERTGARSRACAGACNNENNTHARTRVTKRFQTGHPITFLEHTRRCLHPRQLVCIHFSLSKGHRVYGLTPTRWHTVIVINHSASDFKVRMRSTIPTLICRSECFPARDAIVCSLDTRLHFLTLTWYFTSLLWGRQYVQCINVTT